MAHYLVTRPDLFHTAPLAVMVAVLAAWALADLGRPRLAASAAAVLAGATVAYAIVEGADRRWLELRVHRVPLRLAVADGVRERPARARLLERAVGAVQRRVPPGRPIYVATRRSDLVTSGHPLFYVHAGRPNPTRYDIAAPGVLTSAPVQREIVRELERARPRVVVRWTDPVTAAAEPNRAGRSTGVTVLDRYLRRQYRRAEVIGTFVLLRRRAAP
jgi:hypothetical protein